MGQHNLGQALIGGWIKWHREREEEEEGEKERKRKRDGEEEEEGKRLRACLCEYMWIGRGEKSLMSKVYTMKKINQSNL